MREPRYGGAACALLVCCLLPALAAQNPEATWRGKPQGLDALAQSLGEAPVAAAQPWLGWAVEHGYRLVFDDTGRVLLVLSETYARRDAGKKEDNTVERFLGEVQKALAEVDRLLPPPEDQGTPPATVVVIGVRQRDYEALLPAVAAQNPQLAGWATEAAATRAGFTLAAPLVGVWIEDPPGTDEWSPDNEVVHRVAAELIARCAPHLPPWLHVGLSWHVEDHVMRSLYCFPYRNGFVSAYEHTDWHLALKQMWKHRDALRMEEIAGWNPRLGFDRDAALLAFGAARFLAQDAAKKLPALLAALSAQTVEQGKVTAESDGWDDASTWTLPPDYVLPADAQLAILREHAGDDVLARMSNAFKKGASYRPKG